MKRGKQGPNRKRYKRDCVMDSIQFQSARPEAKTCCNACRSSLRRWVAKYGADPLQPPGRRGHRPSWYDRASWFRVYVNMPVYEKQLKARKKKVRA